MNEEKQPLELLKRLKGKWLLLLLAVSGIVLLLFGGKTGGGEGDASASYHKEAEAYRLQMEVSLTKLCQNVAGVGEVQVLVTLQSGEEYVYAKDISSSGGEDFVVKNGEGLLLYREVPVVGGVVVVCTGGGELSVQNELTRLLHASLGVPYSRICITASK